MMMMIQCDDDQTVNELYCTVQEKQNRRQKQDSGLEQKKRKESSTTMIKTNAAAAADAAAARYDDSFAQLSIGRQIEAKRRPRESPHVFFFSGQQRKRPQKNLQVFFFSSPSSSPPATSSPFPITTLNFFHPITPLLLPPPNHHQTTLNHVLRQADPGAADHQRRR